MRAIVDRGVASFMFVALAPVLIVIALAIRLRMGRPILFRQERIGHRARPFTILKFRTMVPEAEEIGRGYLPPGSDLVPPLGKFLRRTSLDELPQLINIMRGEMSFVGPRPALPDQYDRYTDIQAGRVAVPQGVTGLAQVRYRNNAPWSRRIESDLEYVSRLGLSMDCWILAKTVVRTIRGDGVISGQTSAEVDDLASPDRSEEKEM